MDLVPLQQRPDAVALCARWAFEQWGAERTADLDAAVALWRQELAMDGLPLRWIAVEREAVLGMASLLADDLPARPDLGPWLGDVFTAPAHRRRGVASALVRHVERAAADRGIGRLYLHTDTAERLYAGLGWTPIGRERDRRGSPVTVMAKRLALLSTS